MKILDRYILKSHIGPFLLCGFIITGVLFTDVLTHSLDEFLAKGISVFTIAEVLFLSLGHLVALSIPMAVLMATLMAFGQLNADNELTALRASGVSLWRVMLPAIAAAGVVCAGMFAFDNWVLPESNHRLAGLLNDITRTRPTVNIQPGVFVTDLQGYQILIGDKNEKTDEVRDVQVYVLKPMRNPDILVAPRGRLHFTKDGNTLYIELYDGEMHALPDEPKKGEEGVYRVTRFTEHTEVIHDLGNRMQRTQRDYRSDREMGIAMMRKGIAEKRARIHDIDRELQTAMRAQVQTKFDLLDPEKRAKHFAAHSPLPPGRLTLGTEDRLRDMAHIEASAVESYVRQIRSFQVEIHKKFAITVACIVFVLLGAPLAIRSGKSGMTMAIGLSISCFFFYYIFITGGEKLADREYLPPWFAMWVANMVFGVLGLVLTWRTVRETTPIDWERLDPRAWLRLRRRSAA
jgi:lipopolysaccharide export system permease protein